MPDEINQNDIIYYLKKNTSRKRFDDFNNGIGLSKKIKSARTKLGEEKKTAKCVWIKSKRNMKKKI